MQAHRQIDKQPSFISTVLLSLCALILIQVPKSYGHELNRETAVVKAVRDVSPAVVNISSAYEVRKRTSPFSGFGLNPFFDEFFRDFFDPRFERRQQNTSLGSGVIIDGEKGLILTNAHVIQKAGTIKVVLQDEREFEARIVGADPDSDLAVLKIDSKGQLPAIKMGSSEDLMVMDIDVKEKPRGFPRGFFLLQRCALRSSPASEAGPRHPPSSEKSPRRAASGRIGSIRRLQSPCTARRNRNTTPCRTRRRRS